MLPRMSDMTLAEKDPSVGLLHRAWMDPYPVAVGPDPYVARERQRLAGLTWEHFDVRPVGACIGAEIVGVDITSDLPDPVVAELRRALCDYKVIFFRGQPLTAEQHVRFGRRFGDLEVHPFIPPSPDTPELVRFEKSAEVGGYENSWHHDVTWRERPSMGAILHAIQVPAVGGDTLWADMYAAYEGLGDDLRARADGLDAVHDFMRSFGRSVPADQQAAMRERFPMVVHPVVCTHAETGRRHLYGNRNFVDCIVGVEADESTELIDRFARMADYPEYQCRWHWEADDVAFWDNRAAQHYASSDYWPEIRVMERASVVGSRPAR